MKIMAYEDPNAPLQPKAPAPAAPTLAPAATPEKKSNSWDWLWPSVVAVIIVNVFGLVGGLVAFGCYYWLRPKLGTWGAVATSSVFGVVVAIVFLATIRS